MSSESKNKIKSLTHGNFAKKYFTKNGLKDEDINEINQVITNKINNNEINIKNIEKVLQTTITEYRLNKKIIKKNQKLSKNTNEKELLFRINNNFKGFKCIKCDQPLISEFNFCPNCGNKVDIKDYKIRCLEDIDLNKGYVTPNEIKLMRWVSPEERELLDNKKVNPLDIGIEVTEDNCPFDIRYELYKNENFRNNKEFRKNLFNQQKEHFKNQENNFKLITFNQRRTISDKKFPLSYRQNQPNEIREYEILKREFLQITKKQSVNHQLGPKQSKQGTKHAERTLITEINLEYAGVLYLLDVIKHPKSPKLSNNVLNTLNISSNKKVINYLRKNNYLINAEGRDLTQINLQQKKIKDLKKILTKQELPVSGTKDEVITRIIESLPQEELVKYSKGKALKVTNEGQTFIYNHPQVEIYLYYLKDYPITEFETFYQENNHINLTGLTLAFINKVRNEFAEQLQWRKFLTTYQTENRLYKDMGDIKSELETCINIFICALNPWTDNAVSLNYSSPINQNLQKDIIKLKTEFSEQKKHELFMHIVEENRLPGLFLEPEEMYQIFNSISDNNLEYINNELESKFDKKDLKPKDIKFTSEQEQNEVFEKVKDCFR